MVYISLPALLVFGLGGVASYVSYHMARVLDASSQELVIVPAINWGILAVMAGLIWYMDYNLNKSMKSEHQDKTTEMFDRYPY